MCACVVYKQKPIVRTFQNQSCSIFGTRMRKEKARHDDVNVAFVVMHFQLTNFEEKLRRAVSGVGASGLNSRKLMI